MAGHVSDSIAFKDLGGWAWGLLTAMGALIVVLNLPKRTAAKSASTASASAR